ncbi:MAG TPA: PAS domain S-box protein [Microvirga sp.]|nr:PAS domain S-box protein [Microvirga sp.]
MNPPAPDPAPQGRPAGDLSRPETGASVEALERELKRTRASLERTVRDLEAANEELTTSNAALLAANEELHAANEALAASQAETQAANRRLAAANADLENLLRSTRIAAILLDSGGRIRGFTPAARGLYDIGPGDVGRALADRPHRLLGPAPLPDPAALARGDPVDDEVEAEDGRWFLRRVLPYRGGDGAADGTAVTFTDVTAQKRSEEAHAVLERRQSFLLDLDDRLRAIEDPFAVMETATERLGRHLAVGRVGYGEIDGAQDHVVVERDWTAPPMPSVVGRYRMEDFGPELIAALKAGRTVAVADIARDARTSGPVAQAAFAAIGSRTVAAVPLVKDGALTAMLFIHHPEPRPWPDGDVRLVEEVAERTWAAVERARAEAALRESEARFRDMADSTPMLIWVNGTESGCEFANRAYLDFFGKSLDEVIGFGWTPIAHPDDAAAYLEAYVRAFAERAPFRGEARFRRADGAYRWLRSEGLPRVSPVTGAFQGYVGSSLDITDAKEAEAALREGAERLQLALSTARMGDWSWDAASDLVTLSERAAAIFGLPPGPGATWTGIQKLLHPADAARAAAAVSASVAAQGPYDMEYRVRRATDGAQIWVAAKGQAVRDRDGRTTGMTGVVQDITELKHAQERQHLLIRELHHRVKNTLATVQAIVGSTARTASSIDEFYRGFVGRIVSLAHTHNLLTEDDWQKAPLDELLRNELGPYEDGARRRVRLEGPAVELPSEAAVPIGMAIHELTTNAAKHGSLSRPSGRVEVRWGVAPEDGRDMLDFVWTESGGPPLEAPQRQGFGSRLLQRVLAAQLQAEVRMDYAPDGLRFHMRLPLPRPAGIPGSPR